MAEDQHGERTFEPTEHRREEFRKQGKIPRARDLGGLAATAAIGLALFASRARLGEALSTLFVRSVGDLGALERLGPRRALGDAAGPTAAEILPVLAAGALLAFTASFAQAGFRPNPEALALKFERLDPSGAFERLFSFKKNAIELAMSLLRVSVVGYVAYWALAREVPNLLTVSRAPLGAALAAASGSVGHVLAAVVVALFVVAAADYAQSRFTIEREMKMTRKERMDEARQQEGDPKAKGRMRARARAMAKKRALSGVKDADVIVTNPTHVAVALRYGAKDVAPVVVAKGHDEVALRIRAEGRRWGVPILENRALARALDAQVPVGRPIPQVHFAAVAQVLAFVYRLKKRGAIGGTRRA